VQRAFLTAGDAALIDYLPGELCRELQLPGLRGALEFLHQPPVGTALATLAAGVIRRSAAWRSKNCSRTSSR